MLLLALTSVATAQSARSTASPEQTASAPPTLPTATDARLQGYLEAWLWFVHQLGPEQVAVAVADGTVTLTGRVDSAAKAADILAEVRTFAGVRGIVSRLEAGPPPAPGEAAAQTGAASERWRSWLEWVLPPPGKRIAWFPVGNLFTAPLADQKQPRFHSTWQRYRTDSGTTDIASLGFGEEFGILRVPRQREGDGLQLGVSGAVFAIFNLDAESFDLLNADYYIGFPLSFRHGPFSARARLFHQSSHLGDELLLEPQPTPIERINLSFEALELLASWERRGFRAYGGGSFILHSDTPLGRDRAQLGVEYRGGPRLWRSSGFVVAIDIEAWDETDWDRDVSVKAGIQIRSPYGAPRSVQFLLEHYNGHSPHGQFYPVEVEYWGLGVAYSF